MRFIPVTVADGPPWCQPQRVNVSQPHRDIFTNGAMNMENAGPHAQWGAPSGSTEPLADWLWGTAGQTASRPGRIIGWQGRAGKTAATPRR